jgi:hypothetical protein
MMARRRRESGFESSVELASRLPWWLGIILAVVSYLVLHQIADAPVVSPVNPHDVAGSIAAQLAPTLGRSLATFGQYLLPVIFLVGAALSAAKAYRNRTVIRGVPDRPARVRPAQDPATPVPRTTPTLGARPTAPACPSCGAAMVRRVAKRGANSGREFWGCSRYPACKGIR